MEKIIGPATRWLLIVGGLNWGLVAFMNYNVVDSLLGTGSILAKVVYGLVAAAAVYKVYTVVAK